MAEAAATAAFESFEHVDWCAVQTEVALAGATHLCNLLGGMVLVLVLVVVVLE